MLGDITPPRSFLHPSAAPDSAEGGSNSPPGAYGGGSPGLREGMGLRGNGGGGGGGEASAMGGHGDARGIEQRQPPGVLSVIVGLPFRLLGKVREGVRQGGRGAGKRAKS